MTERLYYTDSYLREFTARIVDRSADGRTVYLDRTAFYPTSGGQPFDTGSIAGIPVLDVVDEEDRIAHRLAAPLHAGPVDCAIDWTRRFDHMQQHTGQHLLSAVFEELFGLHTVSFHLGADSSTIDLEGAPVDPRTVLEAERRANEIVFENRPVAVQFRERRRGPGPAQSPPSREGTLRIVSIDGLDRSACGGTHVRSTGEIGAILLRKTREDPAVRRASSSSAAPAPSAARAPITKRSPRPRSSSPPRWTRSPALVAAQIEAARAAEKARRKLELDLAAYQGRELYDATAPGADGVRRVVQTRGTRQPGGTARHRAELHRAAESRVPRHARPTRRPSCWRLRRMPGSMPESS